MSYTTSGITFLGAAEHDGGVIVRAGVAHADKVLQLYVSGRLAAWAVPEHGTAELELPVLRPSDVLFFLAVDLDEAAGDFFDQAFPAGAANGNRIRVCTPQRICGYEPGDRWQVYRGDAGDAVATILAHEQDFYPQGRGACGYGSVYGYSYGYDGADARGYGHHYGLGEYGFDCDVLEWVSDPLPPGTYPIRVAVEDEHGNASTAYETSVTLNTYPRPAGGLTVDSYDPQTDTLELSWTQSPDIT